MKGRPTALIMKYFKNVDIGSECVMSQSCKVDRLGISEVLAKIIKKEIGVKLQWFKGS